MWSAADIQRFQPIIAADTVIDMHDIIAGLEIRQFREEGFGLALARHRSRQAIAENILFRDENEIVGGKAAFHAEHGTAHDRAAIAQR